MYALIFGSKYIIVTKVKCGYGVGVFYYCNDINFGDYNRYHLIRHKNNIQLKQGRVLIVPTSLHSAVELSHNYISEHL